MKSTDTDVHRWQRRNGILFELNRSCANKNWVPYKTYASVLLSPLLKIAQSDTPDNEMVVFRGLGSRFETPAATQVFWKTFSRCETGTKVKVATNWIWWRELFKIRKRVNDYAICDHATELCIDGCRVSCWRKGVRENQSRPLQQPVKNYKAEETVKS
jgi:hypothetical protein